METLTNCVCYNTAWTRTAVCHDRQNDVSCVVQIHPGLNYDPLMATELCVDNGEKTLMCATLMCAMSSF